MSTIPNRFYRVSIKALILNEERDKFLIIQEDNGKWELPGGGLDWGEEVETCLKREIEEEMGITVTHISKSPSYFITWYKEQPSDIYAVNILYETRVENLNFRSSDECVAIRFVSVDEVAGLDTFPNILKLASVFKPENHIV